MLKPKQETNLSAEEKHSLNKHKNGKKARERLFAYTHKYSAEEKRNGKKQIEKMKQKYTNGKRSGKKHKSRLSS